MGVRPWLVFSSSTGETFRNLWNALTPEARAACTGFVVDRDCGSLRVAREIFPAEKVHAFTKATVEAESLKLAPKNGLILLCGYFGICSANFIDTVGCPVVNTHPSLLPSFPGLEKHVHLKAAESVAVSGFSIHLVTETLDGGPILFQQPVWVDPRLETAEVRSAVRAAEQKWLPKIWERLLRSDLNAADRQSTARAIRQRCQLFSPGFMEASDV